MKKSKKILIVFLLLAFFSINIYANQTSTLQIQKAEYTEEYKEWLKLSDEEKEKLIAPRMYDLPKSENNSGRIFFKASSYPTKFSLRDKIPLNMKAKNQLQTNTCWIFAGLASLESNLAFQDYKSNVLPKEYDFSERHVEYSVTRILNTQVNEYGFNRKLNSGGGSYYMVPYLTNGMGAILEADMPFENNVNILPLSSIQNKEVATKVSDYAIYPSYDISDSSIKDKIKNHIQNYGGLVAGIYGAQANSNYYNKNTYAIYCNNEKATKLNHEVLIVGWDDDFAIENFSSYARPKNKGAWIIKNSWGTGVGDNGFMYVSYEDVNIYKDLSGIEKSTTTVDYDNIYQYNELGWNGLLAHYVPKLYLANDFTKKTTNNEYITEVSVSVPEECICKVYVNVNGTSKQMKDLTKVTLKEGESEKLTSGYHTLEFATPIKINSNDFTVVLEMQETDHNGNLLYCVETPTTEGDIYDCVKTNPSKSFVCINNATQWYCFDDEDLDVDTTIKVFTKNEIVDTKINITLNKSQLTLDKNKNEKLIAIVTPSQSQEINWSSSNTSVAVVDGNGNVTAKGAGTAIITAQIGDVKATCNLTVQVPLQNISLNKSNITLNLGQAERLIVSYNPSDTTSSKSVTWSSSNTSVATVDGNGNVTAKGAGTATITAQVSGNYIVRCTVTVENPKPKIEEVFSDIPTNEWYYESVEYVYNNKLIVGYDNGTFGPNDTLTRAMLVTIIWRMDGEEEAPDAGFLDVGKNEWYYKAVNWARSKEVIHGYDNNTFGPNDPITREQVAVIFNNYARAKGENADSNCDISRFLDYYAVDSWALPAVRWAVENKIINGKAGIFLDPLGTATRAEASAILMNYCKNIRN